jgi:hypothetical protein
MEKKILGPKNLGPARDVPRPRPNRHSRSRFRSVSVSVSVCLGLGFGLSRSRFRSVSASVSVCLGLGFGLSRSQFRSVSFSVSLGLGLGRSVKVSVVSAEVSISVLDIVTFSANYARFWGCGYVYVCECGSVGGWMSFGEDVSARNVSSISNSDLTIL